MRHHQLFRVIAIGVLGTSAEVYAQDSEPALAKNQQQLIADLLEKGTGENLWSSFLSVADSSFLADNKQFNLDLQGDIYRLNFDFGEKVDVRPGKDKISVTTVAFNGSLPVSQSNNKERLPSLNDLANGSTLEFSFSKSYFSVPEEIWNPERYALWETNTERDIILSLTSGSATAACMSYVAERYWNTIVDPRGTKESTSEKQVAALRNAILQDQDIVDDLDNVLTAEAAVIEACNQSQAVASVWNISEDKLKVTTFGGSAKIGQEDFGFKDMVSFQDVEVSKTTYAFSAFARFQKGNDLGGRSLNLAVEFQHAFKDNDPSTVCRDPDDMATCVEAVFGPPQAEDSFVAKASYAHVLGFKVFGDKPAALSLNANYNIDNDIWGLEAPVFLYRDDKNLGAGVRAGWRSDTDNFEVGFFVSQKFSL